MTMYKVPLSREDAETIHHAQTVRLLQAADPRRVEVDVDHDDAYRSGQARRWIEQLLRGNAVEIDEDELIPSRIIVQKVLAMELSREHR